MAKRKSSKKRLSSGEMEILAMLWDQGPVTLSQAQESLGRPIGYTTMQTRLNRLVEKQVVRRSKDRPARYEALVSPEDVSANQLDLLLDRVTGGKVVPLVAHLVDDRSLSSEEIDELKRIVKVAEERLEHLENKGKQS